MRIEESLNVTFDESLPEPKSSSSVEDDRINEPIVQDLNRSPSLQVNILGEGYPKNLKEAIGHPIEQVIGELNERTLRHDYNWYLSDFGKILSISSTGTLFYCMSTSTLNFKKIRFYHPNSTSTDPLINGALVQNVILKEQFHYQITPSLTWDKSKLHDHLKLWAKVLLTNVFLEIKEKKELPIIVGYMLFCIKTHIPFNFAYFLEKRMDGIEFNLNPIPFARIITTLAEFIKNEHLEDDSRVMEVDDVLPMSVPFIMDSIKF
ncbi:hypothetical protein Tco_0455073 [Tanacetum coccineum]